MLLHYSLYILKTLMKINTIILAAGKGTRMKSNMAKVLHKLAGKTMLQRVVESVSSLHSKVTVVFGHGGEEVKRSLKGFDVTWAEQTEQLGTGHAVQQAQAQIVADDIVLILYGDVPLIRTDTLAKMVDNVGKSSMALLTVDLDKPAGYGRIVRSDAKVTKIVEEKDADEQQKLITEVNTGIMAVRGEELKAWLSQLGCNNAQSEYYLTDIIEMAVLDGVTVNTVQPQSCEEVQGVNSKLQLNQLERYYQKNKAEELMEQGVTLADVSRLDIRGELIIAGSDIYIDVNNVFEGNNKLGNNVVIGPNCSLLNVMLADNVVVKANSVLEDCVVAENCSIGPFARIRPGTVLSAGAHIGNFVEVKKSMVGEGSKISHLSYIGDATIGAKVNIGAGTITCNYDGVNKHQTIIADGAFIGSGTQLVAPVKVGENATLGAGTTLSKDAKAEVLTITRARQISVNGWKRPTKK